MKMSLLRFLLAVTFLALGSYGHSLANEIDGDMNAFSVCSEFSNDSAQKLELNTPINHPQIQTSNLIETTVNEEYTLDEEEPLEKSIKKQLETSTFSNNEAFSINYSLENFKNSTAFCKLFEKSPKYGLILIFCSFRI